jgi:hypothetical protein
MAGNLIAHDRGLLQHLGGEKVAAAKADPGRRPIRKNRASRGKTGMRRGDSA